LGVVVKQTKIGAILLMNINLLKNMKVLKTVQVLAVKLEDAWGFF
jgi:hypothetical protein